MKTVSDSWITFNFASHEVTTYIDDKRLEGCRMILRVEVNLGDEVANLYFTDRDQDTGKNELFSMHIPVHLLRAMCDVVELAAKQGVSDV